MRSLSASTAALCLAVALSGCDCSSVTSIGGRLPDGGTSGKDGGTGGSGGTGGAGGTGGSSGTGGGATGTLTISPLDPVIDVTTGTAPPTVQFTAAQNGASVSPTWSVSPAAVGTLSAAGLFTPSGTSGGLAVVTATQGADSAATSLTINLHLIQNGAMGAGGGAGAGGVGGVGGEGVGGPVTTATLNVLQSTPTADPALSFLYPYDQTVWPKGILAPLLQWTPGSHAWDAVGIHLACPTFSWDGVFAKTATPFVHHPIPQAAWQAMGDACSGQQVQVKVVLASGGVAYGALTQTWRIASGFLKGVVYYNSYGTKLASNYSGALPSNGPFGGATLAIRGGSTDPVLVAGKTGSTAECRVCHVVSSDGSTLITQLGDNYSGTASYALKSNNTETDMSPGDGRFAWGGLSPNGTLLFSNAAPLMGGSGLPSALYSVPGGAAVATTGIPSGLQAGSPVFSADGTAVAFNWWGGNTSAGAADNRSLAMLTFAAPRTFSGFTVLHTPPSGQTDLYPSFLPTNTGVVFELELVNNGRGFGETRSNCDSSSGCSDTGTRAELWWVDMATKQAHALSKLNGVGMVPNGPNTHTADATLNYEPTVSPIPSGGYAWVIFTSRRMYGNIATLNPFWSDPRFHDISTDPTTKKLWVAAVDLNAAPGTDPSHPAFYLPGQELLAGNSRGYWSLDPCRPDLEGCGSGDQCCGGYCRGPTETTKICSSTKPQCSQEFEKCDTAADCCDQAAGAVCLNARCVTPGIN